MEFAKRALPGLVAASLLICALQVRAGLYAHYRFDGDYVDEVSGNPASTVGTPDFVLGKWGHQAVRFIDNDADQVWYNPPGLDFDEITVAFWVQTTQSGVWPMLWNGRPSTNPPASHMMIIKTMGGNEVYAVPEGGWPGTAGIYPAGNPDADLNDGAWHHVVWTASQSGNTVELYVDTISVGTNMWGAATPMTQWMLGRRIGGDGSEEYDGLIDDYRIYDHALTLTEVVELYNTIVPEPASLSLLIGGMSLIALRSRRREP
jgi:hypothetical protein